LTLNENASRDVRRDFETWFNVAVPESFGVGPTPRGPDDMPAHIKASLLGPSVTIPCATGERISAPGRGSTCASTATTLVLARSP
jgi:thiamine phosphate synthase YjbQ (UPF0047 family)